MQFVVLLALLTVTLVFDLSNQSILFGPTTRATPFKPQQSFGSLLCIHRPEHALHMEHLKRSQKDDISIDPELPTDPSRSSPTNFLNDTQGLSPRSWPPSLETTLTATFRAVVTILSLLNVGFTWRLHGTYAARLLILKVVLDTDPA